MVIIQLTVFKKKKTCFLHIDTQATGKLRSARQRKLIGNIHDPNLIYTGCT